MDHLTSDWKIHTGGRVLRHLMLNTIGGVSRDVPSLRRIGGAALQEEGVAGVADSDWFRGGGKWKLVVRAAVAEYLPAVSTVMLMGHRQKN